jgi:hypothetical protein
MNNAIQDAKHRLPLPQIMEQCGLGEHAKQSARCPFHEDGSNSFSVWQGENGWQWKCHAGCGHGDEINFLEMRDNLANKDATKRFLEMAGVRNERTNGSKPTVTVKPFNWRACVDAFTSEHVAKLADWRGYSPAFCQWLKDNALAGLHDGCIAFPVHGDGGSVTGAHYRLKADGSWRFEPLGSRVRPLVIGDLANSRMVHVFESQWDAFAVCDKLAMHTFSGFAVLVTRGAENGGLVAGLIPDDAEVFAWPQNDPEDKRNAKTGKTPAEKWLATVAEKAGARVRSVSTPAAHKDANDWTRAGANVDNLMAAIRTARTIAERPRRLIEFRTPSQLKAFVPPVGSVLVGDCHIVRGAVFVIGGAPGVGKSRAGVALAEAGATGLDWFGLKVHRKFKTMIIQNENGEHRLKNEFSELDTDVLDPWVRVCVPPPFGLTFEREDFRALLAKEIADFKPDVIVLDPWNAVAPDDRAADYLETFRVIRSVIPAGDNAPALGIVAHTRKPKSDEKASGRGLLNLLAGSYVLGSVPRCAFVLQAASDDPEDRCVVWTCCKNNDGEMGARSAWVRCNGLFQPVTDFDWDAFDNAGSAKAPKWKAVVEIVQAADSPLTKAAIATALKARNVAQATAYRWIDSAAGDGAISFDENAGVYCLPSHCDSQ